MLGWPLYAHNDVEMFVEEMSPLANEHLTLFLALSSTRETGEG